MDSANSIFSFPYSLLHMQVVDFPIEIAVFGIALIMFVLLPKFFSILSIDKPVTVDIIVCFLVK